MNKNCNANGAKAENSTGRISLETVKKALENSVNCTPSSRAMEVIFDVFSDDDRAEMELSMSFNQVIEKKMSTSVDKNYENNSHNFLADMEAFEESWGAFFDNLNFTEYYNEDSIMWSIGIKFEDGGTVMEQIVDFTIFLDMEE